MQHAVAVLATARAGLDPRREARLLAALALGWPLARVLAHGDHRPDEASCRTFLDLLERRAGGEPMAYLRGVQGFHALDLKVSPAVLVPRPETELLVELALARLRQIRAPLVLDLGTGSGAIALAVAAAHPDATVVAVDASTAALAVAATNRAELGLTRRVLLLAGDWLSPLAGSFDVILANPPYIAAGDPALPALSREPRAALVAGADGLDALRRVFADGPARLRPGGLLAVEHGAGQGLACAALARQGGLEHVALHRDLAGQPRVTLGCRPADVAG